jgi:hypothetical protein
MKTLVYENYNKFISATETIRSMKSNVSKMVISLRLSWPAHTHTHTHHPPTRTHRLSLSLSLSCCLGAHT